MYLNIANQGFLDKLKDFILTRLNRRSETQVFTDHERDQIRIVKGHLYFYNKMKINYTTYDLQRSRDIIKALNLDDPDASPSNVMVKTDDTPTGGDCHTFWYALVLKNLQVEVEIGDPRPGEPKTGRLAALWVRWYGHDPLYQSGWQPGRLERIGFLADKEQQFGFISPSEVVRACHLIPAFAHGRTEAKLGPSAYRPKEGDYEYYYVNRQVSLMEFGRPTAHECVASRFVDRDMALRYTDLGVGHLSSRKSDPKDRIDYADGQLAPDVHDTTPEHAEEDALLKMSADDVGEEDRAEVDLEEGKDSEPDVDSDELED